MILSCSCAHLGQDTLYGPGKRLHNLTRKSLGGSPVFRCTVCRTERTK